MLRTIIAGLGIIVIGSQVGCKPIHIRVNAMADVNAVYPKDYILLRADEDASSSDLEFVEYSRYLNKILTEQGFEKAPRQTPDTIVIVFDYGIGEPELHRVTYEIPVRGVVGYSSSTTNASSNTTGSFTDNGYGGVGYSGNTTSESTTTYEPEYGVVGYKTGIKEYTTFTRYFDIAAYQQDDQSGNAVELWRVLSTSTGSTGDLRTVVPYMLIAMKPYIGKNTPKGEVLVTKRMNSREAKDLISSDFAGIE